MSDDARKIILARRTRFVAAAIAGVGIACGKEKVTPPQPCLQVAIEPDAAADAAPPAPCLSVYNPPPDAAPPRPCLSPVRPRPKEPCDPKDPLCVE